MQYSMEAQEIPAENPESEAVDDLILQGSNLVDEGRYIEASQVFEQAMQLNPRNGQLYFYLAGIRLKQGRPIQAEQTAKRGLRFGQGDRDLLFKLWVIIAVSRERSGDLSGSEAARAKASAIKPH